MITVLSYRINRIETKQFATLFDGFDDKEAFDVNVTYDFHYIVDKNTIANELNVMFTQNDQQIMKAIVVCYYNIDEKAAKAIKTQKVIDIQFLRYIATITTGTTRGIISAKTEGTPFNKIILPPINLNDCITENFKIE